LKLEAAYYLNPDVIFLARDLLGKVLYTAIGGKVTAGMIVETEAYFGEKDKASHAYNGRRTNRTEIMYNQGGVAYVYLCYGMHHLFNVVSSVKDEPHAILIRGIEPMAGLEVIEQRRGMPISNRAISAGPGSVAKALGIDRSFNAKSLIENDIWIDDQGITFSEDEIITSPRIGIAYAKEHALLPLRFYVKNNKYVSKPNKA